MNRKRIALWAFFRYALINAASLLVLNWMYVEGGRSLAQVYLTAPFRFHGFETAAPISLIAACIGVVYPRNAWTHLLGAMGFVGWGVMAIVSYGMSLT